MTHDLIKNRTGSQSSQSLSHPIRNKYKKSLRLGTDVRTRFLIDIDLSGYIDKIISTAIKQDSDHDHPADGIGCGACEQSITADPGQHARKKKPFRATTLHTQ